MLGQLVERVLTSSLLGDMLHDLLLDIGQHIDGWSEGLLLRAKSVMIDERSRAHHRRRRHDDRWVEAAGKRKCAGGGVSFL
jgi:hypothetical protein